jgi:hypothetical protein
MSPYYDESEEQTRPYERVPTHPMECVATAQTLNDSAVGGEPVSPRVAVRPGFAIALTLAFGLPGLFLLAHPYHGIYHDGIVYALQALARLEPHVLDGDLFFRYGSQDSYTVFSPLYAWLVQSLGLEPAAHLVARVSAVCLGVSAWLLARRLLGQDLAWLALALFIVIPGRYSTHQLLSYDEDFATPRVLTEALVLSSLALLLAGRRVTALIAIGVGFLLHPLMALPGLLVGAFAVSSRLARAVLAGAGIGVTAVATGIAAIAPIGPLRFMDVDWHGILAYAVPYLFVDQWSPPDWQPALATLVTLTAAVLLLPQLEARRLGFAGLVVSSAGLALAAFASFIAPVVLMLQGQPWRWLWLGKALTVLLLAPVGAALYRRGAAGRGALALLAIAWVAVESPVGAVAALCALIAVIVDVRGNPRWVAVTTWASWLLAATLAWAVWRVDELPPWAPVAVAIVAAWLAVFRTESAALRALAIVGAAIMFGVQAVAAVSGVGRLATFYTSYGEATYQAFAPWRERIRPEQTVYFPGHPDMVLLVLRRRSWESYTAVLFSRDAALAIRERHRQLRRLVKTIPVKDPTNPGTWHELDLTVEGLQQVCRVPEIDFVATRDSLPLPHLTSDAPRPIGHVHLYACADAWPGAPH